MRCFTPLPRQGAQVLTLVVAPAPSTLTDFAAPFSSLVCVTDALEEIGAVCQTSLREDIVLALCKTYETAKRSKSEMIFLDEAEEDYVVALEPEHVGALISLGIVVGPPLDSSFSEEVDVSLQPVISWFFHLIGSGGLLGIAVELACSTFSILRRPADPVPGRIYKSFSDLHT